MNLFSHKFLGLVLMGVVVGQGCGPSDAARRQGEGIAIRPEMAGGKQTYVLENAIYKAVLVPEIARFPVSLINKSTGHDFFAQLEPLDAPNDDFRFYGGIVDCLPWVSGKRGDEPLQSKGLLYTVPWRCTTGVKGDKAWFEGTADIAFLGPVGSVTNQLRYIKRVTGKTGSAEIRLDQRIENTGTEPTRFTITLHGRTAVAKYDAGDYLFVPGKRAYVSYMTYPALTARGIAPSQWIDWPLPEAVEFLPSTNNWDVFIFTPASWGVAGDDKSGEALVFKGGKVSVPEGKRTVRMALFMTNKSYLLEPGLTSCIQATPETWKVPENTILLAPGQVCEFSVTLTALSDVHRKDWPKAINRTRGFWGRLLGY